MVWRKHSDKHVPPERRTIDVREHQTGRGWVPCHMKPANTFQKVNLQARAAA